MLGKFSQIYDTYEDNGTKINNTDRFIYTWGYSTDGDSTSDDVNSKATTLRHGNYDYFTNSTIWDSNISDQNLPASLYLSSKPSFFGNKPWPLFGSDVEIIAGTLPAEDRFNQPPPDTTPPSAPTGLVVE